MGSANEKTPAGTGADKPTHQNQSKLLRKGTKKYRVLEALASGLRFNRFYAERVLHDHVLNTTVSDIQRDYGIIISREITPVPGYDGSTAHPAEYWLEKDQLIKARKILGWQK